MNIQNVLKMFLVVGSIGIFGCGGGGSSSSTPPTAPPVGETPVAKTTTSISGSVTFPSLSSLVAKQVALVVDTTVSVQAFTLEGVAVGSPVTPSYDETASGATTDVTKRVYTYSLPDIPIGKDYVIKAKRLTGGNTQELKKLIEKSVVVIDPVQQQDLSSVSTTAVVIASQKLTDKMVGITGKISLGDPLPSLGASNTITTLSNAIVTDVAPKSLETSIQNAKDTVSQALLTPGGLGALTMTTDQKKSLADLVNMLNIIVAAVSNNYDPTQVLAGTATVNLSSAPASQQLKLLSVTGDTISQAQTVTTTINQTVIQNTVTSAVVTYVPPRVKLELLIDTTALYGLVLDITIPADAKVRTDATGKLDMALVTVPAGVSVDAQFNTTSRKIRIALASGSSPLPSAPNKLVTIDFDRTLGKTLTESDFAYSLMETSDITGNALSSSLPLTKTVTSSGS